jgi:hypothetical protein
MTRDLDSKTTTVLNNWTKNRPLTAPAPAAAPAPVYHLAYRWRHTVSPEKVIQAVFTPAEAQSFAHAYEQFLDFLQATTAEAKAEGYQPAPVLLGVNGIELLEEEWQGHLRDATLAAVDQAAETGCPPEWPEGHNPENYALEPSTLARA